MRASVINLDSKKDSTGPNIIADISEHLASAPRPRMKGWRPRTKPRQLYGLGQDWMRNSYPDIKQGEEEAQFAKLLGPLDKPTMASIQSIMQTTIPESKEGKPSYTILVNSDALQNHNFSVFIDGIFVMASQGDTQESTGRHLAALENYPYDNTQGPASAMSAVDATAARRVFRKDCDMMLAWLKKYDQDNKLFDYQFGYLTPKADQVQSCLQLLEEHGLEILMNVQQVRIDNAGQDDKQWLTQIPCFALALGGYDLYSNNRTAADKEHMPKLCEKLLALQYQAVARLAVLKSIKLNRRIPLVLTAVGGGVFGNDRDAIMRAIQSIGPIIQNANVDLVMSVYNADEIGLYRTISFLKDAPAISHTGASRLKSGDLANIPQSALYQAPPRSFASRSAFLPPPAPAPVPAAEHKIYLESKQIVIEFPDEKLCVKLASELKEVKAPELKVAGNIVGYTPNAGGLVRRNGNRLTFCTYKNTSGDHVIPFPDKATRDLIISTLEVNPSTITTGVKGQFLGLGTQTSQTHRAYFKGLMNTYNGVPHQEKNIYFSSAITNGVMRFGKDGVYTHETGSSDCLIA